MNKKILTTGALWAYGLACVATNQKDQECKNVLANPVQTQAPVVIQEENVRYLKTENGIKKLHRVIDETEEPSIKPTKKPVVSKKNNASEPTNKPTSKQQKQNKSNKHTDKYYVFCQIGRNYCQKPSIYV